MEKKEIVETLQKTVATKRGKALPQTILDRVNYTVKKAKESLANVTKNDLNEVMNEVMSALTAPVAAPVPVANSPKLKAPAKKPTATETPKPVAKPVEKTPAPKTEAKKPVPAPKKKANAKVEEGVGITKTDVFAKVFPETLTIEGVGEVKRFTGSYDKIAKIIDEGGELYLATYWTKRHLKMFAYEDVRMVKVPNGKFPDDLDVLSVIVKCESVERLFAMSVYTEGVFQFDKGDFAYVEVEDQKTSETFKIRIASDLEFEVYVPVSA